MTATEERALLTAQETVRRLSAIWGDYERVVPRPWLHRALDAILRVFGW